MNDAEKNIKVVENPSENWGGKRAGSGRKSQGYKTIRLRFPEPYENVIKALIAHLDEIDKNQEYIESEPFRMLSIKGKKQHITFKTEPL